MDDATDIYLDNTSDFRFNPDTPHRQIHKSSLSQQTALRQVQDLISAADSSDEASHTSEILRFSVEDPKN